MFVYIIVNHMNWKYYIGKTKNKDLQQYWRCQKRGIFGEVKIKTSKPHLYNAVRKYGWEIFSIHSLRSGFTSEEECLAWEQTIIKAFRSQDPALGYNICSGGRGAIGWKPTLEQRIKMGASRKGKPGRKQSPETRAKIKTTIAGLIAGGQYRSPETCAKISATKLRSNRVVSPETRTKLSASHRGKRQPLSQATRAKISAALKGKKHRRAEI